MGGNYLQSQHISSNLGERTGYALLASKNYASYIFVAIGAREDERKVNNICKAEAACQWRNVRWISAVTKERAWVLGYWGGSMDTKGSSDLEIIVIRS